MAITAEFFTVQESDRIRGDAIKMLDQAIKELWRHRKKASMVAQSRVYMAIGSLAKIRDAILTNTELDEIYRMLEDSEDAVKDAETTRKAMLRRPTKP